MTFTVDWDASAAAEAISLWLANFPLRPGIDAAVNGGIAQALGTDAHLNGYALDNCRVVRVGPLTVLFTVSLPDRVAEVVWVSIAATQP